MQGTINQIPPSQPKLYNQWNKTLTTGNATYKTQKGFYFGRLDVEVTHFKKVGSSNDDVVIKWGVTNKYDRREPLKNEYTHLSKFKHPHIIKPYEFGYYKEKQGGPDALKSLRRYLYSGEEWRLSAYGEYLILPKYEKDISGFNRCTQLPSKTYQDGILKVLDLMEQMLSVLQCFQEKEFTHGDIKPENILVDSRGNYVLADFGGGYTEKFVAPEFNTTTGKGGSDMFSLGATCFKVITGDYIYARARGSLELLPPERTERMLKLRLQGKSIVLDDCYENMGLHLLRSRNLELNSGVDELVALLKQMVSKELVKRPTPQKALESVQTIKNLRQTAINSQHNGVSRVSTYKKAWCPLWSRKNYNKVMASDIEFSTIAP